MIEFLASGQLPTINNDYITVPGFNSERDTVPLQVWTQAWTQPYNTWAAQGAIDDTEIPRDLFMAAFGSTANPNHLVLADAVLNNYKASVSIPGTTTYESRPLLADSLFKLSRLGRLNPQLVAIDGTRTNGAPLLSQMAGQLSLHCVRLVPSPVADVLLLIFSRHRLLA